MEVYLYNSLIPESPATYVGSTTQPKNRYLKYNRMHFKCQKYFYNWASKHGIESMQHIRIPIETNDEKELRMWEDFYIGLFGSYVHDSGIGLNLIRNPTLNASNDEYVKAKKRERFKGSKNPMYGKVHSKESKARLGSKEIHAYKVTISGKPGRFLYKVDIDSEPIVFNSIRECTKELKVERRAVQRILDGIGQTSKGYTFKRA